MVLNSDGAWTADHRLRAGIELATYVAPKRKAVGHSSDAVVLPFVIFGAQPPMRAPGRGRRGTTPTGRAAMIEALLNGEAATLTRKSVEPMRPVRWTSADLPTP